MRLCQNLEGLFKSVFPTMCSNLVPFRHFPPILYDTWTRLRAKLRILWANRWTEYCHVTTILNILLYGGIWEIFLSVAVLGTIPILCCTCRWFNALDLLFASPLTPKFGILPGFAHIFANFTCSCFQTEIFGATWRHLNLTPLLLFQRDSDVTLRSFWSRVIFHITCYTDVLPLLVLLLKCKTSLKHVTATLQHRIFVIRQTWWQTAQSNALYRTHI